jgi:hypothetical protein
MINAVSIAGDHENRPYIRLSHRRNCEYAIASIEINAAHRGRSIERPCVRCAALMPSASADR